MLCGAPALCSTPARRVLSLLRPSHHHTRAARRHSLRRNEASARHNASARPYERQIKYDHCLQPCSRASLNCDLPLPPC